MTSTALAALAELVRIQDMMTAVDWHTGRAYDDLWSEAWANARAALLRDQGEVAALREALRRHAIEYGIRPPHAKCRVCGQQWRLEYGDVPGEPERHASNCLAQLEPPEGK